MKRRRPLPAEPQRIGLLRASAIGDTVLLSGIAGDLRQRFRSARLIFFAGGDNVEAARLIGGIDEVVAIDLARPWRAAAALRRRRIDLLLDFAPWPRVEALIAVLSGAGCTIGFCTPRQHRHYCFDLAVPHSESVHELENQRRILEPLGIDASALPRVAAPDPPSGASEQDDQLPQGRYVVLHLWPGGFQSWRKEWPLERWQELMRELAERGCDVVLTGGPADRERSEQLVQECIGRGLPVRTVAGKLSLAELMPVLRRAECLVSVNTGVMHLGAAAGVPTVGLNGPTSSVRWGPVGEHCVSVDSSFEGCGFLHLGFEYAGQRSDCMAGISVSRVLEAVASVTEAAGD